MSRQAERPPGNANPAPRGAEVCNSPTLQQQRLEQQCSDLKANIHDVIGALAEAKRQNNRLEAEVARFSETAGEDYERGVQAGMKYIERLEAEFEERKTHLHEVIGFLDAATRRAERLEAVVEAARDLLRYAGIKHPGADNVIVSRERVRILENTLAALDSAAPETPHG